MTAAATTHLTPEAVALVQQAAAAMQKAQTMLAMADGRQMTLADLHRLNGPAMRAATLIRRANSASNTTRNTTA
jgi:hypothetical protein